MITDFPSNPIANMAGLAAFEFAPYQSVDVLPAVQNDEIKYPVVFKAGQRFLKGYATISTLNFSETSEKTKHGPQYTWEIIGFTPGRDPQLLNLMKTMTLNRHIVKTFDFNNQKVLVGYQAPLNFTWAFATGTIAGEDRKGFAIRFFGQSNEPAPAYNV